MCTALLAAVALIVALADPAGRRARCFAGARGGLPRYLGLRTILQAARRRVPETAPSRGRLSLSFRLHVWIAAWRAGRRNDFEMTELASALQSRLLGM
jgi:hypothetical protein